MTLIPHRDILLLDNCVNLNKFMPLKPRLLPQGIQIIVYVPRFVSQSVPL